MSTKKDKEMLKDFEKVLDYRHRGYGSSLDDLRKMEIVHSLYNKFGTAIELAKYLESKGVDVE